MNTESTQAIAEYSPTEAALAELRQQYQGVQFDVATTKGDKAAREARQMLVKLRTGLEAKRKEIKAPALAYAKAIDTEAARITAAIRELEEPIDAQIRAEEARKAAEKAEKERLERQRVAEIKGRMDAIRNLPVDSTGDSAEQLAATLADLKAFEVTQADFAEFTEDATVARGYAIEQLERMHGHAVAREEEAARQAAAAAELERLRREQEEREAQERAAQQEAQRKLDAERAEFERQKAEFEAQQRAAAEEAQRKADAEAQALVAKADVTDAVVAAAEAPQERWCNTMDRPAALCGCPDCGSSLIDFPAPAEPAPGTQAACPGHSWLLEDGQDGTQPCPECAFEAASPIRAATPGCARFESEAQIIDGRVVIAISIPTLAHAARNSDYFFHCAEEGAPLVITDELAFAKSVVQALNAEAEDGSTPITRMLDAATEHVSEQGEPGIEEGGAA